MKKLTALILAAVLLAVPFSLTVGASYCAGDFVCCDVNGDEKVTLADVTLMLKYIAGWDVTLEPTHADAQPDGALNLADVVRTLKYIAGWSSVHRLGHVDEYSVYKEATTEESGIARYTCTLCGDFEEVALPVKIFEVCGCDLADYTMIFSYTFGTDSEADVIREIADYTYDYLGLDLEARVVGSASEYNKKKERHEILFGTEFNRSGIERPEGRQAYYGICEDGTVYFTAPAVGMYPYLWARFLEEQMGVAVKNGEMNTEGCSLGAALEVVPLRTSDDIEADGYKLVFSDDFDGDSLDYDAWELRGRGKRDAGYISDSQISVSDGNLYITGEYREDGEFGPGWYSAFVRLRERYCRGYYESRIRCNEYDTSHAFWSAFWIQGPAPYKWDKSMGGIGPGGAELDIIECYGRYTAMNNIYTCGAAGEETTELDWYSSQKFEWGDCVDEYRTYALEWDEDFYRFYIDGVLVGCTDFANGTSSVPEEVILSLCIPNAFGEDKSYKGDMIIDYVKIWQK